MLVSVFSSVKCVCVLYEMVFIVKRCSFALILSPVLSVFIGLRLLFFLHSFGGDFASAHNSIFGARI